MNKKTITLILSLFLLTGCTINYDVTINKDLTVVENMEILGDDRFKIGSEYTVDTMYETLKETYSELHQDEDLDNIKKYSSSGNMAISSNKTYKNLEDFAQSKYIKKIYVDGLKIAKEKNLITISSDNNLDNFWLFVDGMEEEPIVTKLEVKIKVPYVVTKNNADQVDNKTNTYTWTYDFRDYSKRINLEFDKNRIFKTGIDYLKIIKYILYIIGLSLLGYIIYRVIKLKNKKNNKI